MPGASGIFSGLAYIEENNWGEIPTPVAVFQSINFTESSLVFNIENVASNSIRADRQTGDLIQVGAETSGGFTAEFQAAGYDTLLGAALFDSWLAIDDNDNADGIIPAGPALSDQALVLNHTTQTVTIGAGNNTPTVLAGQRVMLRGAGLDAGNEGVKLVQSVDPTGYILTLAPGSLASSQTLEADAELVGWRLRNGSTRRSLCIEQSHADVGQFIQWMGLVPASMELSFESGTPLTLAMEFLGKKPTITQSTASTSPYTAAASTPFMNAVSSVGQVAIDGVPVTGCLLQSFKVKVDNKLKGRPAVGVLGYCDVAPGPLDVTGEAALYFADNTFFDKYLAGTEFSLATELHDALGNYYTFDLPRCKFATDNVPVAGKEEDVVEETTFNALASTGANSYTVQVCRFPAAA